MTMTRSKTFSMRKIWQQLLLIVSFLVLIPKSHCAFQYLSFEDLTAINFIGEATTTSCVDGTDPRLSYSTQHGQNDDNTEEEDDIMSVDTRLATTESRVMDDYESGKNITNLQAGFGHRTEYAAAPNTPCSVRVRLTPSEPSKKGAMYYNTPVPLYQGFSTEFSFQITDQTRTCNSVKDRSFSTKHHKSCMVHGGDGLAFVMHGHTAETSYLGSSGSFMGYGGLQNILAVEFDTWYNPDSCDIIYDHVTIHASGIHAVTNGDCASGISFPRQTKLADGNIHTARIAYYPTLAQSPQNALLKTLQGTSNLEKFLVDKDEKHRPGILAVWVDNMTFTDPLVSIPINLGSAVDSQDGELFVGLTASTGRAFQKHDIINWRLSESIYEPAGGTSSGNMIYHTTTSHPNNVHPAYSAPH